MSNFIIAIVLIIAGVVGGYLYFFKKAPEETYDDIHDTNIYNIDYLCGAVKDTIDNVLKMNYAEQNMNALETEKAEQIKTKLRQNLKLCKFGNLAAKYFVRDYIVDLLQKKFKVTPENINMIIPFNAPEDLTTMEKWDILLYFYESWFNLDAFEQMNKRNNLVVQLPSDSGSGDVHYEITRKKIEQLYNVHLTALSQLKFTDLLYIVGQRIYQKIYGHGVIDELRDMHIDGIMCGTSGIPNTFYTHGQDLAFGAPEGDLPLASYNAIWAVIGGKKVHFSFMGFETQAELERVAKNIYRYNDPGTLSMNHPYMISESQDGCRVVVVRPPMTASWGFFVRKLDVGQKKSMNELYPYPGVEKLIKSCKYLIKGCRNTAITGAQGTGKSTFMMSVCQFIPETMSIRTQEKAFELNLQKIYPKRNVVSFRETEDVPGQVGLNVQKKTDGDVNLVGEVAEASVATWAIQTGQVGSAMTMFTHHAKTAHDLVTAFRNNMIEAAGYNNEKIVETMVAQVLNINIHISRDIDGNRYIERITEIRPTEAAPYPKEIDKATIEYYYRSTDREVFKCVDILACDPVRGHRYVGVLSEYSQKEIKLRLTLEEQKEFDKWIDEMTQECKINNPAFFKEQEEEKNNEDAFEEGNENFISALSDFDIKEVLEQLGDK